ncbi:hypothetical protein PM082_012549 [Marasmius tenuissimus]|nr:hypothetical protein PM082_012549 [Marasmius tenuissimus]
MKRLFPFLFSRLISGVLAICPGLEFGVGNIKRMGGPFGANRWNVYDNNCGIVDGLTTNDNPCNRPSGIFSCTPSVTFAGYKHTFTGQQYACRPPVNADECGGDEIAVCCG